MKLKTTWIVQATDHDQPTEADWGFHAELDFSETAGEALEKALTRRRYARLVQMSIYTKRDLEPVPVGRQA